jgi:hypothetical protein
MPETQHHVSPPWRLPATLNPTVSRLTDDVLGAPS